MAAIAAFGHYLPKTIRTNEQVAAVLGIDAEWIFQATGIRERRIAEPHDSVVAMAVCAAKGCRESPVLEARKPGLILMSSGTAEHRFPGPAAEVAHGLSVGNVPAIDLPLASAGSLFALALAADLTARYGPVLVVASERMSGPAYTQPLTKEITPLFGDGAAACLVLPDRTGLTIVDHTLESDGTFHDSLALDHGMPIHMDGRQVILQASRKMPAAIRILLERNGIAPETITKYLTHQANQNLTDRVAKVLGVPTDRFFTNIARYGNTSSASLLIALSEYFRHRPSQEGELFCLAAFGAGFHSGSLLLKTVTTAP